MPQSSESGANGTPEASQGPNARASGNPYDALIEAAGGDPVRFFVL